MNNPEMKSEEKVLSVSQFNNLTKAILENDPLLNGLIVRGEISGFKRYPSGHLYFSVKDENAALSCVMFQSSAKSLRFLPVNGMLVRLYGTATIYPKDGRFQFSVRRMTPDGIGGLMEAYEKLKNKLKSEGLFDAAHKKEIPAFPRRIGVITSPAGAAFHDVLSVTGRRFPCAQILLYPSAVQGEEAPEQLRKAVLWFSRNAQERKIDLLIIGRGGGSAEDLWAFNDEDLARALYDCPIPTISAVGHETDFTICDFVCDLRAPTPSAAAELATPDRDELFGFLADCERSMTQAVCLRLGRSRDRLNALAACPVLRDPAAAVEVRRKLFSAKCERFTALAARLLERKRALIEMQSARMVSLNPLAVLTRGYSAVFDREGRVVRSVDSLKKDDVLTVRLSDGNVRAIVDEIKKEDKNA